MGDVNDKFERLGIESAPGQEKRQVSKGIELRGDKLTGTPVDFSHGDVDAFEPIPGSREIWLEGFMRGGKQAYTEYRGDKKIREDLAVKLSKFTNAAINADQNIILTPGTQGALFLAMGSLINKGDKVAIVEPDYFANRKLVEFFEGELVPIHMDYYEHKDSAGLNLEELEQAFQAGVKLFLFSNPNNPVGNIYSFQEISIIAKLAKQYNVSLIVDELYSRQVFENRTYTHLCGLSIVPDNLITIIGPSKTESMSGYRLGIGFGSANIIDRMEKLQAIVSLRAGGYNQSVFQNWFNEPKGWLQDRIEKHQAIRDDIINKLKTVDGVKIRSTEAGSYLFIQIPEIDVPISDFAKILRILADITITPGTEFGPQFTNCFRINFSQDHKAVLEAMDRFLIILERYRKA